MSVFVDLLYVKYNIVLPLDVSSIGAGLAPMTSRRQIQDGDPHDFRSKMAAPVTRSVTPRRVSQRPRPREGSVTS